MAGGLFVLLSGTSEHRASVWWVLGYNDLVSSFMEILFSCIDSNNHSPRLSCFNHWSVQSLNSPAKASPVLSMSTGGLMGEHDGNVSQPPTSIF